MNKIDLCLQIAVKAHEGQIDKNGEPYILHPLAVGLMGSTDEERMAGFLHVKYNDLTHNLSRANSNEWFQRKYQPALAKVKAALEDIKQLHTAI